jgi:hypothetical protein
MFDCAKIQNYRRALTIPVCSECLQIVMKHVTVINLLEFDMYFHLHCHL